ncbi:putative protein phosphatase 2C 80 [Wolffia australiana]
MAFHDSTCVFLDSVLESARRETTAKGTSTALIGGILGNLLYAYNVSDSGVTVVRGGAVIFRSVPRHRGFNVPFQLGCATMADSVSSGESFAFELRRGDIIVAAIDGLFNSVFEEEITVSALAMATVAAYMSGRDSPYSLASHVAGRSHAGGKVDDVTVIVVKVCTSLYLAHKLEFSSSFFFFGVEEEEEGIATRDDATEEDDRSVILFSDENPTAI